MSIISYFQCYKNELMRLRQTKNKTSPCCSSFTCRDFVHTWSWCFSMPTAVLPRLSGIFFPFLSSCIHSCSTVSSQYHWPFLYERVHQALIFSQVTKWCFAAWSHVLLLNCHQDFPLYTACFLDSLHSLDLIIIKGSSVKGGRLWRPTFFFLQLFHGNTRRVFNTRELTLGFFCSAWLSFFSFDQYNSCN